jgi:RimJ/RimL family protein N-acetyltransferase
MAAADRRPLLVTPRLTLRRLDAGDAAFVVALLNDPDWIANIGDRNVRDEAGAMAWIERGPQAMFRDHGFGLMACDLREGRATIGICGLIRRPGLDDVDLGYALLPAFRGQGYGTEAAQASLAWGRDAHGLRRVVAIVTPGNADSVAVLARCGLVFEREILMPGADAPVHLHAVRLGA